jgi:TolA-binding protein
LTEQPEALQAGIAATERAVRRVPLNRAYRELLAWLYMEAGDFPKALDANRAIDRLEQEEGRVLYGFAQSAADAGAYDVASEAYAEILERYPDAPTAPDAQFGVALMHEQWARKTNEQAFDSTGKRIPAPHFDQALAAYRDFMDAYPGHRLIPDALRRVGTLQQEIYFELLSAEQTFLEVLKQYPTDEAAAAAEYELGRLALLRGDLDPARMAFSRLVERLGSGELADRARYELALIHFYNGEFEAARTVAEAINRNTSSLTANDAIELKVLLLENTGPDSLSTPLRTFARAHFLQRQRRPADAIETLDRLLSEYGTHALADDARFLRAQALRDAGKSKAAAAAFAEIPVIHPASFRADRSLFMAAEIMEPDLRVTPGAIDMYTRLLTEYPGSLLVAETRSRIRTLRGDNV